MAIEGVPSEMLAVQVVEFNKPYKIHNVPTPQSLRDYDVLVKTAVASLCHTDSLVTAGVYPTKLPCTGSHEGTGTVVAIGSKVKNFKPGDRIMSAMPLNPCGTCYNCKGPNDWHQYCENFDGHIGVFIDGAFADYHITDSRNSCIIPDSISFINAAPLACAGITIYRAIKISEVKKGGWMAINGAGGGLGHLGIQFALALGINVVAIDARDQGMELCKKAGAKHILDVRNGQDQVIKDIKALTDGLGVEATLNLAEHETSAALACAVTRMHGTMIQISQPEKVCIPFQELIFRDIHVIGTLIAGQEVSQEMLYEAAKHDIKVETNVFYGLNEVPKMIELAHSGNMKGKAVCVVDETVK